MSSDETLEGRCPACGIEPVDQFMACSGFVQWRIDCPGCGDEGFPTLYGERLSVEEAERIIRAADVAASGAKYYG